MSRKNRFEDYQPDWEREEPETEPVYREQRRRSSLPLILLLALLILGMLFAAWRLGSILLGYARDRAAYSDIAENAVTTAAPHVERTEGEEVEARYDVSYVPISVDWDYLQSVNPEIVGWLYCPGTIINYPVVQTTDNDFYLDHGFDREYNSSGALFADVDSAEGVVQSNFIIYGHNMKDKSMFGSFQAYVNRSYYEENPIFYYLTPNGAYRVDLFGAHIVEGTVDNFPTYFGSIAEYQDYVSGIRNYLWYDGENVDFSRQMMTLSTCTSASGYNDARLVLHGIMIPIE